MRKLRPHFLIYFGNFAVFPHDSTQSAESRRCTPPQDLLVLGCRPQQENGSGVTGAKARLRTSQLEAADLALTATCHEKSHFSFDQWNMITWFRVDHYVKQTSIKLKRREIVNSSLKFWLSERIEWKCFNRRKMRVSGTRGRIWKLISLAISSFSIDTQSGHIFTRLRLRHFRHCGKLPTGVRFLLSAAWKLGFDKVTWHLKRQSREGVFLTGRVPPVGLVTTLSKC